MPAAGDEIRRLGRIRLLDEAGDRLHAGGALQRGAGLDIAVAGLGCGRLHAEGDDPPGPRRDHRLVERGMQGGQVGDGGVGGHQPEHRLGILCLQHQGGGGDGGRAVAADRLQQDAAALDAGLAQLLRHQEAVRLVADHQRRAEGVAAGAAGGFLQHGLGRDERPELLRVPFPRQRPETGARATRKDHWNDHCEAAFIFIGFHYSIRSWAEIRLAAPQRGYAFPPAQAFPRSQVQPSLAGGVRPAATSSISRSNCGRQVSCRS